MKRLPMILAVMVVMVLSVGAGSAYCASTVSGTSTMVVTGSGAAALSADVTPAAATGVAGLTEDKAVALAKRILPELEGQSLQVDYDENLYEGRTIWRVSTERPGYVVSQYRPTSISIDAETGMLVSFSRPESSGAPGSRVLTRQEAQNIAESYLAKTVPAEIRAQLAADDSVVSYQSKDTLNLGYGFRWHRVVNGIPVSWDGVSLRVNAVTGDVFQYDLTWNAGSIVPPAPGSLLSPREITDRVLGTVGLAPQYVTDLPQATSTPQIRLVYTLNSNVAFFNAATGEGQGYDGKSVPLADAKRYDRVFTPRQDEAPAPTASKTRITPEEGLSAATSFFRAMGYQGRVERSGSGSSGGPGYSIEMWGYAVLPEMAGQRTGAEPDVMIDTRDGRVVSFSHEGRPQTLEQAGLGFEQAKEKALGFMAKVAPELTEDGLVFENTGIKPQDGCYVFNLTPLVNGIPFTHRSIHITVDAGDGSILNYHSSVYPVAQVPPAAGMISVEEAEEIFRKYISPELMYIAIQQDGRPTGEMALVYHFPAQGRGIDAHNGAIVDGGDDPSGRMDLYDQKIGDHWAQASLLLLAEDGLLPDPQDFNPDAAITRRDGVRLLAAAATRYWDYPETTVQTPFTDIKADDPDLAYFDRAVRTGLFTGGGYFYPDGGLTREQFTAWLVNALGYKEVALIRGSIETPFRDGAQATAALANYVALAGQLGLVGGDAQGNFRPRDKLTWGEAAAIITMAAPRLQNSRMALYH